MLKPKLLQLGIATIVIAIAAGGGVTSAAFYATAADRGSHKVAEPSVAKMSKHAKQRFRVKKNAEAKAKAAAVAAAAAKAKAKPVVPVPTPPPAAIPQAAYGNPLGGRSLYADMSYPESRLPVKLLGKPVAAWMGDWNPSPAKDVSAIVGAAAAKGSLPVLVAYNMPARDCGGYSAGGASSVDTYKQWINSFAQGIAGRPAAVIVEPDAVAGLDCLSAADQATHLSLLSYAVGALKAQKAFVYIDAGNPKWQAASTMATRLKQAGIAQADGFALNVSNFITTADNVTYGNQISALVGGKHFVIDTSRNGRGPAPGDQWCNPHGRGLGALPTTNSGSSKVDALLWIKTPGESDGECNGGPAAGEWWQSYADELALNALF